MTAENYHLKWDSHLSYLNSSVATLYKNEKFADVVLYSSSSSSGTGNGTDTGIPTVGISAHKFILSSCSQFFATMFDSAPIAAPNGVLNVVLPPDLSHRAIQILVQYMYSGEATVSNDILSEVLRGGEILKIRGLCRTAPIHTNNPQPPPLQPLQREVATSTGNANASFGANGTRSLAPVTHAQLPSAHASELFAVAKCPPAMSSCSTRYTLDAHTQQQQQFRGLGASVMPKDSPVIVKSPKMPQLSLLVSSNKLQSGGGITVNKEVAIDPEDKCCFPVNAPEALNTMISGAALCNEIGCRSCPMTTEHHRRSDELVQPPRLSLEHLEREYSEPLVDEQVERVEVTLEYERRLRKASGSERLRDYFVPEHYEPNVATAKQFLESATVAPRLVSPTHQHSFLAIKQEPTDWSTGAVTDSSSELISRPNSPMQSPKQPLDFKMPLGGTAVKIEANSAQSADEDDPAGISGAPSEYINFTRLICDVCKKSFDDPKTWVRHLDSHNTGRMVITETVANNNRVAASNGDSIPKTYVPKKRRRVSQQENSVDHVTLLCDLCSTSFETPAEWVRHMNNQHTEIELAMFNSKKDNEQKTHASASAATCTAPSSSHHQHQPQKKYTSRPSLGYAAAEHQERVCDICSKKFSSHSSLVLHKQSHGHSGHSASASSSPVLAGRENTQSGELTDS